MSGTKKSNVPPERSQWLRGIKPGDIVRVSSHAFNLSHAGTTVGVGIVTATSKTGIAIDRVKDVAVRYRFRRSDGLQHGEMGPHMGRIDPIPASEIEGALQGWLFATQHPLDKRRKSEERDEKIKAASQAEADQKIVDGMMNAAYSKGKSRVVSQRPKSAPRLVNPEQAKSLKCEIVADVASAAVTVDAITTPSFLRLPEGWTLPPHMLIMGEDGFIGCMRDGDELLTQYLTGVSYFASPVTECPNCSHKISIARMEKR